MKKLDIKRALAEHNMSQIELCQKIGVAQQNMSAIVRSGNPTVAKLMQIAEGIGCDITDLFYPDPAEESAAQEENSHLAISQLKEIMRRAYPSIETERVEEIMKMIEEKGCGHKTAEELEEARKKHEGEGMGARLTSVETGWIGGETALDAVLNGDNLQGNEPQGGTAKVETFCPHCGKRVRVGVVLLDS